MQKKDVILTASRSLALLLRVWALVDVMALPEHLFSLVHYRALDNATAYDGYMSHLYLIEVLTISLRIIALLAMAESIWRCGPKVERFFSLPTTPQGPVEESEASAVELRQRQL